MLAPFAPHVAEELYERLGHDGGLFESARWPRYDEAKTRALRAEIVVQVNGKVRGRLEVDVDADEAAIVAAAHAHENVARHLGETSREGRGPRIRKTIFVPGRLLNFVVG